MLKATFNIRRLLVPVVLLAAVAALLVFTLRASPKSTARSAPPAASADAQHLVSILQYLESDYPAAVASNDAASSPSSGRSRPMRSRRARALPALVGVRPSRRGDRRARAAGRRRAAASARTARRSSRTSIAATGIARTPSGAARSRARGAPLRGELRRLPRRDRQRRRPRGARAEPEARDFHSAAVMDGLTPFKAFNVIRFGVKGTAMVPFDGLDEKQRWALAFYLFSLRQPACDHAPPRVTLDALANTSDPDAREMPKARRARLPSPHAPRSRRRPRSSPPRARRSKRRRASRATATRRAPRRRSSTRTSPTSSRSSRGSARTTATSVTQIEASFTTTRAALQERDPRAQDDARELIALSIARRAATHATSTQAVGLLVLAAWSSCARGSRPR